MYTLLCTGVALPQGQKEPKLLESVQRRDTELGKVWGAAEGTWLVQLEQRRLRGDSSGAAAPPEGRQRGRG